MHRATKRLYVTLRENSHLDWNVFIRSTNESLHSSGVARGSALSGNGASGAVFVVVADAGAFATAIDTAKLPRLSGTDGTVGGGLMRSEICTLRKVA